MVVECKYRCLNDIFSYCGNTQELDEQSKREDLPLDYQKNKILSCNKNKSDCGFNIKTTDVLVSPNIELKKEVRTTIIKHDENGNTIEIKAPETKDTPVLVNTPENKKSKQKTQKNSEETTKQISMF